MLDGKAVGGVVVKVDGTRGELELLFVSPRIHSKGVGYAAWCVIEKLYPQVTVWETVTPYFEKRNIHFYVNRCEFHIVEFYNSHHIAPNDPDTIDTEIIERGSLSDFLQYRSIRKGNIKTYYQMTDGTWFCDGYSYQYRLDIKGRLHNAACDSEYVYLSNIPEISFEQAWKASGLSSDTNDYFQTQEAVLVEMK